MESISKAAGLLAPQSEQRGSLTGSEPPPALAVQEGTSARSQVGGSWSMPPCQVAQDPLCITRPKASAVSYLLAAGSEVSHLGLRQHLFPRLHCTALALCWHLPLHNVLNLGESWQIAADLQVEQPCPCIYLWKHRTFVARAWGQPSHDSCSTPARLRELLLRPPETSLLLAKVTRCSQRSSMRSKPVISAFA